MQIPEEVLPKSPKISHKPAATVQRWTGRVEKAAKEIEGLEATYATFTAELKSIFKT